MMDKIAAAAIAGLLAAGATGGLVRPAAAQTLVEQSAEARMQLDFHVPDAALKAMLPAGFEPNIATTGAAKDANLRMIFIDRIAVTAPDGAPVGSSQMVYLAIPVKQAATNTLAQMLIFGLTGEPKEAPGPFGVYLPATTHHMERSTTADAQAQTTENWAFTAASGEHMELHLKYDRGIGRKASNETKFFSSVNPSFYQIFKVDQNLDIMRNATITVPDKVKEFQYKASGGKIGALFDGSERVLSIDCLAWYNRAIYAP
ncbi:MAG TPA: hypothetical protein VGL31_10050 [Xanthobacteraceae bacterium]|jgi:hypothetical protein